MFLSCLADYGWPDPVMALAQCSDRHLASAKKRHVLSAVVESIVCEAVWLVCIGSVQDDAGSVFSNHIRAVCPQDPEKARDCSCHLVATVHIRVAAVRQKLFTSTSLDSAASSAGARVVDLDEENLYSAKLHCAECLFFYFAKGCIVLLAWKLSKVTNTESQVLITLLLFVNRVLSAFYLAQPTASRKNNYQLELVIE